MSLLLTGDEAAEALRVSKDTIWRMCKAGDLALVRVGPGRHRRILADSVARYVADQLDEQVTEPCHSSKQDQDTGGCPTTSAAARLKNRLEQRTGVKRAQSSRKDAPGRPSNVYPMPGSSTTR